jgi:integrase
VIQRRERRRRDGTAYVVWRVRWHEADGAERSRTFDRRADAVAFEAKVRLAKRAGDLPSVDAGRQTLTEFAEEWWDVYAKANLETATLKTYASAWNRHALPRLGHVRLRELTPAVVARFRSELEDAGVGAASVRKTMTMLQSMLRVAVEWQRIPTNPVKATRKPSLTARRAVRPIAPETVEQLREWLLAHCTPRDAVLVSVLAYAGVRPQEALAVRWRHVRERTLLVEEAVAYGKLKGQKTGRPPRTVRLLAPLRQDLAEWQLASGRPDDDAFVFPAASGDVWHLHDWQNWPRRVFAPAAAAVGLDDAVPYDLRHSFASLLIHEGRLSVVEIAQQLGHSPTMTLNTYGHVIAELAEAERVSAEELIRQTGAESIRPISGPRSEEDVSAETSMNEKTPPERGLREWAMVDSNHRPLPYQRSALTD